MFYSNGLAPFVNPSKNPLLVLLCSAFNFKSASNFLKCLRQVMQNNFNPASFSNAYSFTIYLPTGRGFPASAPQ